MIRSRDMALADDLDSRLLEYSRSRRKLPGIVDPPSRYSFVAQLVESTRRIRYVTAIRRRPISIRRMDPNDLLFDPLKASLLFQESNCIEESFWMVFLFVHFGKHRRYGWRYARRIYGRPGSSDRWDWAAISVDPAGFRSWLKANVNRVAGPTAPGGFGNHRKYESLDPYKPRGTGAAFESYVRWIGPPRTHLELFSEALEGADNNPRLAFDDLYKSMRAVASFGRVARFDYLTMVGKLGLARIEPGSPYLPGSTGPLNGARLLFEAPAGPATLDGWAADLADFLGVGMQAMEDALCNWQKSPKVFAPFRG